MIELKTYLYPSRNQWREISKRPLLDVISLHAKVGEILGDIRTQGDEALRRYSQRFDGVLLDTFEVSAQEIAAAQAHVSDELKAAIEVAMRNINAFHAAQATPPVRVETMPGVTCWQRAVGIDRVGIYVPGGSAPLFSTVLMLALPARIANCGEVIMCTPPDKTGQINPIILYTAQRAGVDKVYKIGGAQAIGAMAYGTESVPKVFKIFGPGNQYVMAAKQCVSLQDVAIDMPAGPSEVLVVADAETSPAYTAADLLSQAEHGADSQSLLVTTDAGIVAQVNQEINRQVALLPRSEIIKKALANSKIVILKTWDEAIDFINDYAPEHLIINTVNYAELGERIRNAGSVFLGAHTPESAGDYASGTNHTLPTNGYATAYSGVNLDSFTKKITYQEITAAGLHTIGGTIETMAAGEELQAHKNAISIRLKQ